MENSRTNWYSSVSYVYQTSLQPFLRYLGVLSLLLNSVPVSTWLKRHSLRHRLRQARVLRGTWYYLYHIPPIRTTLVRRQHPDSLTYVLILHDSIWSSKRNRMKSILNLHVLPKFFRSASCIFRNTKAFGILGIPGWWTVIATRFELVPKFAPTILRWTLISWTTWLKPLIFSFILERLAAFSRWVFSVKDSLGSNITMHRYSKNTYGNFSCYLPHLLDLPLPSSLRFYYGS